jgi:hypothetical protein
MKTTKEIITIIKKVKEKVREVNKDRYPEEQRINPFQTIMLLEKELKECNFWKDSKKKRFSEEEILQSHNELRNNLYELKKIGTINSYAYQFALILLRDIENKLFGEK